MRVDQLDLNLLAVLEALLAHGSATRAADQLNMAQPTISSALARLRYYFHDDLLVTVGRRMVPTPLALSLQEPITEVLRQARLIARRRAGFDPAVSDAIFSVVSSDYIAVMLMSEVARRLSRAAPNVTLRMQSIGTSADQRFSTGQIDLMIAPAGALLPIDTEQELTRDPLVPVVWSGNTAYGSGLTLAEYLQATHATVEFGELATPGIIDTMLLDLGYQRRLRMRLPNFLMLTEFVIGTPHIVTLPLSLVRRRAHDLPLRILQPGFELPVLIECMRWPKHLAADPGATWFRELVRGTAEAMAGSGERRAA